MNEVLFEVGNVLEECHLVIERDVVKEHEMLVHLAHVADVGNHRKIEELRHEANSQEFADSGDASAVHLNERKSF